MRMKSKTLCWCVSFVLLILLEACLKIPRSQDIMGGQSEEQRVYVPPSQRKNKSCGSVMRGLINKLTVQNVVFVAQSISKLFENGELSRANVLESLSEVIVGDLCGSHDVTPVVSLSIAGVVRGLQLLHGSECGGKGICSVTGALALGLKEGNEKSTGNCGMFLASMYVLGGVRNEFICSVVEDCLKAHGEVGVSCALSVLRVCGKKLVAEVPANLNRIITSLERIERSKRGDVLLSLCKEIARGRTQVAARKVGDENDLQRDVGDALLALIGDSDKHILRRRLESQSVFDAHWSFRSEAAVDKPAEKRRRIEQTRNLEKALAGQRFSTEAKRQIFGCISSASDDVECFQMLVNRDPSGSQLGDTFDVLLQCCVREPVENPFYVKVLQRLVSPKKQLRHTLQFAIWDRFKAIRIEPVDITGYVNLASLVTSLLEEEIFHLNLLRGLDLDETSKTIGLFTRLLLFKITVTMSPKRLLSLFFGSAHERTEPELRKKISVFFDRYLLDENEAGKWMPHFCEVLTRIGTANLDGLPKRISTVSQALKSSAN